MSAEDRIKAIISAIANIEKRVDAIVADPTVKVYRDEPIIVRASEAEQALPEKYREMKRIAAAEFGVTLGEWSLFYRQGKFMEDYCDSYDKNVPFLRYYPTYRQMNDRQLRTYFTWRTAVRRGEVKDTYLSYVYVYLYELINLIGCRDAEDGLEKLLSFTEEYSKIDGSIKRYADRWARDMQIFYEIPSPKTPLSPYDDAAAALVSPDARDEERLFDALCALSTFDLQRSKLCKAHPEEYRALTCRVYAAFSAYCERTRKQTLYERLFGKAGDFSYDMFPSAVFYNPNKRTDREYGTARRKFVCKNGNWRMTGYPFVNGKSPALGSLLRTVDSLLRPYFGMEPTKPGKTVATLSKVTEKTVEEYFRERRDAEARKIEFDFSKLDEIRTLSEITKERLVSEEEVEAEDATTAPEPEDVSLPDKEAPLLTEAETEILRAVIEHDGAASRARSHGLMLSAAVDSINEKLFEVFFDTVIEFDGDTPVAVEDYIEELKGYAGI